MCHISGILTCSITHLLDTKNWPVDICVSVTVCLTNQVWGMGQVSVHWIRSYNSLFPWILLFYDLIICHNPWHPPSSTDDHHVEHWCSDMTGWTLASVDRPLCQYMCTLELTLQTNWPSCDWAIRRNKGLYFAPWIKKICFKFSFDLFGTNCYAG